MYDQMEATGAVLVGRRTAQQADHYNGNHHGVPIVVVSRRPPPASVASDPVGDVCDRRDRKRDGAGEGRRRGPGRAGAWRVHGAALEAGVLDELQIHQVPVLFGRGRRRFDVLPSRVELEIVQVIDTPQATHIRHRVRR